MIASAPKKRRKLVAVKTFRDGREVCNMESAEGRREYRQRLVAMCRRQGWNCSECGQPMHQGNPPTFDHEAGRGMGGGHRDDRIVRDGKPYNSAMHWLCNSMKGSRRKA